jgi:hypothetical protein
MTMTRKRRTRDAIPAVLVGLACLLVLPGMARAQNTCNGIISFAYTAAQPYQLPGDIVRVGLTLGAGAIQGGTSMTVNRLRFELDCNSNFALGIPCTDEGAVVEYEGDGTITENCPGVWTTGHAVSFAPNEVVFTPSVPFAIPANNASFCTIEFDVKVIGMSLDATPSEVEQVGGYQTVTNDAVCDNTLKSSASQSGSFSLCPTCNDSACAAFVCDQQTGQCVHFPQADPPASTPCPDTDGNLCTTAGCDGNGNCNQAHIPTVCTPDNNPCTDPPVCNPNTGLCEEPNTPASTPCPDTDGDPCTVAGCDGNGVCNQTHIPCVTTTSTSTSSSTTSTTATTSTTSTSTTTSTAPLCGNGVLDGSEECDPPGSITCPAGSPGGAFLPCNANCTCCVPSPEICNNMIDDDCDGLVDCDDVLSCPQPCPNIHKDPSTIRFGQNGALDIFKSHGRVDPEGSVDMTTSSVGWVLSNARGVIWSGMLSPSDFVSNATGTSFRYKNIDAKTTRGIYKAKIRISRGGTSYGFKVQAYGDLSAATDANMSIQFYLGTTPKAYVHSEPWTRTKTGWKADGFE